MTPVDARAAIEAIQGHEAWAIIRRAPGPDLSDRTGFLADTFAGVVKSAEWEHYEDAAHDDTGARIRDRPLAMVYLDLDVYQSTKEAFDFVWDQVVVGGLVDNYGMTSACAGISKFVHEVKDDLDKLFIQNLNRHGYLVEVA